MWKGMEELGYKILVDLSILHVNLELERAVMARDTHVGGISLEVVF
jgi:hypothetical protein